MDSQLIQDLNFRVLSKRISNLDKILYTLPFAVPARYDTTTKMWIYLKFKGPLFLVQDKLQKKKIVILNQCESGQDYIFPISQGLIFQLKNLGDNGYLLNFGSQDTTGNWTISALWSLSDVLKSIYNYLQQKN